MKPWKTVLIEDQALLRNVLAKTLEINPDFDLLAACETGLQGKEMVLKLSPDLVVTDIDLPDRDGVEIAADLLRKIPGIRILALTNLKDPYTISRIRETGIHGYVEKDQPLDILEEAMVAVAKGDFYFTALVSKVSSELSVNPDAFTKILSPREQQVVRLVAEGLTSKQIARRLKINTRSVETHRYRIMKRLEIKNVVDLVHYAEKVGLTNPK